MIEISSCMNSLVPPPIPTYTNKTNPNHTKPYHISSLYLQLRITAISIHNATLLSCYFRKIATVSHFRLVSQLSEMVQHLFCCRNKGSRVPNIFNHFSIKIHVFLNHSKSDVFHPCNLLHPSGPGPADTEGKWGRNLTSQGF